MVETNGIVARQNSNASHLVLVVNREGDGHLVQDVLLHGEGPSELVAQVAGLVDLLEGLAEAIGHSAVTEDVQQDLRQVRLGRDVRDVLGDCVRGGTCWQTAGVFF